MEWFKPLSPNTVTVIAVTRKAVNHARLLKVWMSPSTSGMSRLGKQKCIQLHQSTVNWMPWVNSYWTQETHSGITQKKKKKDFSLVSREVRWFLQAGDSFCRWPDHPGGESRPSSWHHSLSDLKRQRAISSERREAEFPTPCFYITMKRWPQGFPGGSDSKESAHSTGDPGSIRVRQIPWRRKWLPMPVFLSGEFHGQRDLASYGP